MADYYSILKKTIASLPENNGAARRSVYSRARNAIVNQLKAYEPPLAPSEITAEQLRLEEAIRKVEAEAARESLGLGAAPKTEPVSSAPPVAAPTVAAPESAGEPASPETQSATVTVPAVEAPATDAAAATTPSPLKDTLAEAETLGTAASQATQSAREAVEPTAPYTEQPAAETAPVRQEPAFESQPAADDGLFEPVPETEIIRDTRADAEPKSDAKPDAAAAKGGRGKRSRPKASDALRSGTSGNRIVPIAAAAALVLIVVAVAAYFLLPAGDQTADNVTPSPTSEDTQTAVAVQPDAVVPEPADPAGDTAPDASKNTDRLLNDDNGDVVAPDARTVTTTTITPQADSPAEEPATPPAAVPDQPSIVSTATPEDAPASAEEPPVAVPADNLAAISPEESEPSEPAAAAADTGVQRSILYEEGEESGGAGTAAQGAVVWTIDEETNLDGQAQAVLSASVEIPERDVKVDIRIKPNDDNSLPASHLVEIKYEFPESFAAGDVVNVPGLVMKPTEEARGDALIGASVKVSPGFFWIALSSLPNEQQRNLALLRERGWIDIPMLYENGKRGILTLEKGAAGEDAVEKAITAWQAG